jgi:hypothetical protein
VGIAVRPNKAVTVELIASAWDFEALDFLRRTSASAASNFYFFDKGSRTFAKLQLTSVDADAERNRFVICSGQVHQYTAR